MADRDTNKTPYLLDAATLRLWKQYRTEIQDENHKTLEPFMKREKEEMDAYKKEFAKYEEEKKAFDKKRAERDRERAAWDKLPFWEKIVKPKPPTLWFSDGPRLPNFPHSTLPTAYKLLKEVTWEGFLNWLVEKEKI